MTKNAQRSALANAPPELADFDSVDVDLMFGLPGETEEQLEHDTVEYAFKAGIGQLSAYPLIVFSFTKTSEVGARVAPGSQAGGKREDA